MRVLPKGKKYKQRWRMVGPIQNLGLMMSGVKDLERNYSHWFNSSVCWFLKAKIENQTKPRRFSFIRFGFGTEPKIIGSSKFDLIWIVDLIEFFICLHPYLELRL